ncbi:MAG: class I SAM-dependent methyltransferase, partial [Pseudomonadota bacterium]
MITDLTHEMSMTASRDERARKSFVAQLRGHVLVNMADNMHRHYHDQVAPRYERENGEPPADGPTVHKLMKEEDYFRFYSSIRYNAQEMVWQSVIPGIERNLESLADKAKSLSDRDVGGSLTLDPDLEVPKNVTRLDVHLAPGCYHSEFTEGDVATGAIYDQGLNVFAAGMMGEHLCDIGDSFSNYVCLRFKDLNPKRMLDMGCTVGHNTL